MPDGLRSVDTSASAAFENPRVWFPISAVAACLAAYAVFFVVPYLVNGLDDLSLSELASGGYDPKEMWPRDTPLGGVVWGLGGLLTLLAGPFVALAAGLWSCAILRRSRQLIDARGRVLHAVTVVSAAAVIAGLLSPWGSAIRTWWLD